MVDLKTSEGIDYTRLRDLLAAGKWKKADQETAQLMLAITRREKEGWLREEDIDDYDFPCEDLQTIDQLWVNYSNGRFGFSVQKRIYEQLGGTNKYKMSVWQQFGKTVGWQKGIWNIWLSKEEIIFDIRAPEGHLPWSWLDRNLWPHCEQTRKAFPALISRPDL